MKGRRRRMFWRAGFWTGALVTFALLGLWITSGWRSIRVVTWGPQVSTMAQVQSGQLWMAYTRHPEYLDPTWTWRAETGVVEDGPRWRWGLWDRSAGLAHNLYVALWPVAALSACLTALAWWCSRRRAVAGHCPCGYSLAGLPPGENSPCPECGRPNAAR
ncbi:MAG: hypothetical protein WD749_01390 [Phycisphaerales bacterium]